MASQHEDNLPLIAFTALAPASVGALIGMLPGRASPTGAAIVLGVGLLALAASILHLGHPFRAFRALFGLPSSWLSREVVLFSFYLLLLFGYAASPRFGLNGALSNALGMLAAAAGMAAILATGMVYRLRARSAWNSWIAVASFPVRALAVGLPLSFAIRVLAARPLAEGAATWLFWVAVAALVTSPVLTALRLARLRVGTAEEQESWRLASGRYLWALLLHVAGPAVAVALLLTDGPGVALAWAAALAGDLGERVLFFQAVVPVSMPERAGARGYGREPQAG